MNVLKMAVGLNFLASLLFLVNFALSYYRGEPDYLKYLGLSVLFFILALFYRKRYFKKKREGN